MWGGDLHVAIKRGSQSLSESSFQMIMGPRRFRVVQQYLWWGPRCICVGLSIDMTWCEESLIALFVW